MKTVKLIKVFEFDESSREGLTFDASTRLNQETHNLQLKSHGSAFRVRYPLGPENVIRTAVTNPNAIKRWVGFQVDDIQVSVDDVQVTNTVFRLNDGTIDYVWNPPLGQWTVPTPDYVWSNEGEIADNIHLFPANTKKLQIVCNLTTTDERVTPEIVSIKLLYEAVIDFQLDIIRSLIQKLRSDVRPIAEYPVKTTSSGLTFALPDPLGKTKYNLRGVDSVFDFSDTDRFYDLLDSYDSTTRTVTIKGPSTPGRQLIVRFLYEPEIILSSSRLYEEVSKVPSIVITDIDLVNTREFAASYDEVLNRATGKGWRLPPPMNNDINFSLTFMTDKESDQYRLSDEVKKLFRENVFLVSRGTDEKYRLWMWDEYIEEGTVSQDDVRSGKIRARVVQVRFYARDPHVISTVQRIIMGGDFALTVPVMGTIPFPQTKFAKCDSSGAGRLFLNGN